MGAGTVGFDRHLARGDLAVHQSIGFHQRTPDRIPIFRRADPASFGKYPPVFARNRGVAVTEEHTVSKVDRAGELRETFESDPSDHVVRLLSIVRRVDARSDRDPLGIFGIADEFERTLGLLNEWSGVDRRVFLD